MLTKAETCLEQQEGIWGKTNAGVIQVHFAFHTSEDVSGLKNWLQLIVDQAGGLDVELS